LNPRNEVSRTGNVNHRQKEDYDISLRTRARTTMKMMLRPAQSRDLPSVKKILAPWYEEDPAVKAILEDLERTGSRDDVHCRIVETDKTIRCVSLWARETSQEVRLLALGLGNGATEFGADVKFLREEILEWAEMGVARIQVRVPAAVSSTIISCLRACGFMFEGISTSFDSPGSHRVHLCKHLMYRTVSRSEIMEFLRDFFLTLGYEVRTEPDGIGYRIRSEYRLPFTFSSWQRIICNGPDIVVQPPARVLELHELETLFFPLSIRAQHQRPCLIVMEKKRAELLIDLPDLDALQDSLFTASSLVRPRRIFPNTLAYSYPTGLKDMRRGLPILFYVNRAGAVGTGRVEDWYLDEPKNLYNKIEEMGYFDPQDVREHVATTGSSAGKVLVIRFQWYRPFKRPVPLEEIRNANKNFNPQRTRSVSSALFESIRDAGNGIGA
jgi:hypothetical protein